jgi:acetylornithine/succinyldiaminopimelate/putrescine aminotransferase
MPTEKWMEMLPKIVAAHDDWLRDESGREYIDLCMGYGSVWLGHNHPAITETMIAQLQSYPAPGYLPTRVQDDALEAMAAVVPDTHFLGGLYSTGMEAVETALRAASVHTGRRDIAGFRGSVHGRSFITSAIGGSPSNAGPDFVHQLRPFTPEGLSVLEADFTRLACRLDLAAVVLEPIQMTAGGYEISKEACETLFQIAGDRNIPVIFDETLTGLYRCGSRFYADLVGKWPDILVLGKGMANGFPCAAVILRKGMAWDRERVRPGSTFWNHPLACAAVTAVLGELSHIKPVETVARIAAVVTEELGDLELRGRGAMWCLGVPDRNRLSRFAGRLLELGVVVSYYDRYIRLLPPIAVAPNVLSSACRTIRRAYADTFG